MSLAGTALKLVAHRAAKRYDQATLDPRRTQEAKLLEMVRRNADTEYGRRHGFSTIRSVADYQRQVPVITYEDIREDMNRVVAGALDVFTAEKPEMFAQTSGTTGNPKFVPITRTCQGRTHQDQMRTWMHHALQVHPDLFDARVVSLVSPAIEGHTSTGLPFGSTSGHIYKNMPAVVKTAYAVPYPVFEIHDYEAKYYAIMRLSLEHDVRFLATANPSSILKLVEKADERSEEIVRDIRDGTFGEGFDIDPAVRRAVRKRLHPDPARARVLEAARARRGGRLLPGDYWPRLSLIGCWKGGTVGHYLDAFPGWFDPDGDRPIPVRDWGYLSSEARGSIPLSDEGSEGVLTVATNFFEFVTVAELEANKDDRAKWTFLTADQLEDGAEYYVFFTTTGGLYRYDINDVVRVEGRYQGTPQIHFLRKGRGMTNITGEKVSVNQVIAVMQKVSRDTGVLPSHFKGLADASSSRYVFQVELVGAPDGAAKRRFLQGIDQELASQNIEYQAKRASGRLHAPVLHVMREGWYERARRAQVESGKRAFQAKTELLAMMPEGGKGTGEVVEEIGLEA